MSFVHIRSYTARSFSVRVGSTKRDSGGRVFRIKNIFDHSSYNGSTYDYDFSLLELARQLTFNKKVQAIVLPNATDVVADNTTCLVTGWGNTMSVHESSLKLRAVNVTVVNQTACATSYHPTYPITDRMLCAAATGKDACQGNEKLE